MARKQILLDLMQQGHYEENAFCDGLTQEERERKGKVDDWAPKDVIAHISYWKLLRGTDFQRVLEGGSAARIDDFDHENAKIFERFSDQSWNEIMAYAEEATASFISAIEKLSEADLELAYRDDQPIWRVAYTNGYSHSLIHIGTHYQNNGDLQRAAEITGMLGQPTLALDDSPEWRGLVFYNTACSYSLLGNKKEAIDKLREALAARPNLVEWSKQDPDLEPLHDEPAYQALYENEE